MAGLMDTTDAMVWAQEFVRIFQGHAVFSTAGVDTFIDAPNKFVDEGTMVGWFANAIEVGRTAGRKETCPHADVQNFGGLLLCVTCGREMYND